MNWLQTIVYGLVSGLTEFLPISARAHQDILLYLFGIDHNDPIMDLVLHVAMFLALLGGLKVQLDQIKREQTLQQRNRRKRNTMISLHSLADLRVVKNAAFPMILGMFILRYILRLEGELPLVSLLLLCNGIILYLPERMMHGNKDAYGMSLLDSYLMGIGGCLCILSGLSGIGMVTALALSRGADRQKSLGWALLLMIPCLAVQAVFDIVGIFTGIGNPRLVSNFFLYLLAGIVAYCAARGSIMLIRRITQRESCSTFAYYCWGAALFSFMLYLSVV